MFVAAGARRGRRREVHSERRARRANAGCRAVGCGGVSFRGDNVCAEARDARSLPAGALVWRSPIP